MDIAGWKDLIVCGVTDTSNPNYSLYGHDCHFSDLIVLAQNLIHDLVILSTFLAMAAFVYAGIILLTSGGNPGAKEKAKHVFKSVIIGYIIILSVAACLTMIMRRGKFLRPGIYLMNTTI